MGYDWKLKARWNSGETMQLFPQKEKRKNVQLFPLLYINLLLKLVSFFEKEKYWLFYKYSRHLGLELRQPTYCLGSKTYMHSIKRLVELKELWMESLK